MKKILDSLGLAATNPGTWLGGDSSEDASATMIESTNPANGELIASVRSTTAAEYDRLVAAARESFEEWRRIPAPLRGEAVRQIGNALRDHKDALGSLVTLEMGKIKAEGDGEVQEMIDICDFAVGQSRMMYGKTMHSERPQHRMYEQWHPLGLVGTITAFNFPVAVWSWNTTLASICGNVSIWKPSPKTPLCGVAVQKIVNEAVADLGLPTFCYLINDGSNELAQTFVDDPRINLVSFTGSSAVGRQVWRSCRAAHGQGAARTRRQQRHHRGRACQSRSRHTVDRIRRSRHRGSALHHDAAHYRPRITPGRAQSSSRESVRPGSHRAIRSIPIH